MDQNAPFVCLAVLAAGVVCVGASVYVRGFQEPAAKDGPTGPKSQTSNKVANRAAQSIEESAREASDCRTADHAT